MVVYVVEEERRGVGLGFNVGPELENVVKWRGALG